MTTAKAEAKKPTITLKKGITDGGLAEIYQSMQLKLALLKAQPDGSYERITPFVLCRDFLCDVYSYSEAKKDFGIYGMSFKGSTDDPDRTMAYFQAKFPNKEIKDRFLEQIELLRAVEKSNNLVTTKVEILDDGTGLIIGSKMWLQNALSFSLYTFLLRALCYPITDKENWINDLAGQATSDGKYVASIPPETWKAVLGDLKLIRTDEWCGFDPKTDGTGMIHHNSGFISVFGHHTEINVATVHKNKHYIEMKKRGLATKH